MKIAVYPIFDSITYLIPLLLLIRLSHKVIRKKFLYESFCQNNRLKRRILRSVRNDKSPQFHELSSVQLTNQLKTTCSDNLRHKHQLNNKKKKRGLLSRSHANRLARTLFTCQQRFHQTWLSIRYYTRRGSHTTPKRFSLIDFEGPRVVNSTGMHRNATLLNSSAMERLRSLSAIPLHSLSPSYHPCPRFIPPLPLRSFSRSIPFSYAVSSGFSHFRSRPRRRGSIFAHRSITRKGGNEGEEAEVGE